MLEEHKPKVLVYKSELLLYSETFIRAQIRHLKRWQGVLVGDRLLKDGLALDGLKRIVLSRRSSIVRRIEVISRLYLGIPFRSSVNVLKAEVAGLIHIHFGTEAVRAWPLLDAIELPILITLHGYDINIEKEWWRRGGAGRWMKRYPSKLVSLSHSSKVHFLAVSQSIKNRAIEYGIPKEKITVSYIGVDTDAFVPGATRMADRRQILYVGRLVEKKGCKYLLDAFLQIQKRFPDYKLIIVGNGPDEAYLKRYATEKEINATFVGAQTSSQIISHLDKARVFCLPSITAESGDAEGLPIVVLEAQSCGVPVITSARGGAEEGIIHGVSGYAHQERNVKEIESALVLLLESDERATSFSESARRHAVEKFEISKCMQNLERIYSDHSTSAVLGK